MNVHRKKLQVRVPEWSEKQVTLVELSLGDMPAVMSKSEDRVVFAIEIAGRCMIGDDGKPVGADWLRENVGMSRLSGLMILLDHCMELNGFSKDKEEANKDKSESLTRAPVKNASGAGARKDVGGTGRAANASGVG